MGWPLGAAVEFNRDVRPILSDKCFTCHGPDAANRKTKMRLDVPEGSAFAAAVLERVTTTSKTKRMPPAYLGHDALTAPQVAVLKDWAQAGAPYQSHWAFLPPKRAAGSIDDLVKARLAREQWTLSPAAGKFTLARRVALDLTGLPPTSAETEAFTQDNSPNAFEKLVDKLLASPRYGERMAIRWLEAARYSDTNGYQSDGVRDMWRWRDWVIDAFNRNMRFDQFTVEQIAGDLLPSPTLSQQIATAFHRNHRTTAEGGVVDEEFRVEYMADRAETTSMVWLGLTMGCARCHDHKYDPMTQRDYYSLFAFFNNTPERGFVYNFGNEEPFIKAPTPPQEARLAELDVKHKAAGAAWQAAQPRLRKEQAKWEKSLAKSPADWTDKNGLVIHEQERKTIDEEKTGRFNHRDPWTLAAWIQPEAVDKTLCVLSRHEDYYEGQGYAIYVMNGKIRVHYTFRWTDLGMRFETRNAIPAGAWTHVAVTYDGSMKVRDGHARIYVNGVEQELNILFDQNLWPLEHKAKFRAGAGGGHPETDFRGNLRDVRVYNRALTAEEVSILRNETPLTQLAKAKKPAPKLDAAFLDQFLSADLKKLRDERRATQAEYAKYLATVPTVMAMVEKPMSSPEAYLLKRGAYDARGDKVTAETPHFLPQPPAGEPRNRLTLARWLVSRENPLTSRVTVNRLWQQLFGTGLIKTVEDFGSQGEWPIHPELLDLLAVDFMESGWDVKRLIKQIVLSDTYRQASRVTPEMLARDPENRLFARGPRVRLPAEMLRDQALAVSGLLVEKVGGPSVKPYQPAGLWKELAGGNDYQEDAGEGLYRRSLYTYWKRTSPPPFMINFDASMRETCVVRESRTNTPLQALNLMNDVQFLEASRRLAERMLTEAATERIAFAFRAATGRAPKQQETQVLTRLLDQFQSAYAADAKAAEAYAKQGQAPRLAELKDAGLAAYTAIASVILNLDETVTKE